MKHLLNSFLLLATTLSGALAANCCCVPNDYPFYIKVATGISCSESAQISAPSFAWEPAVQGYNSSLGNSAIGGLSIGCELLNCVDLEVGVSTRSTFKYSKLQTPVDGGDSYTRKFNLDVTPILVSVNVLGRDISCLNWDFGCGTIYPTVGVGLGMSNLLITNFRTTGLPPSGDSAPFLSFSAENQRTQRQNFTYTASIGFEYNYNNVWAIATGYRWFDAGKFKGPRYLRVGTGSAVDVGDNEWKMRFRANEWFVELKIFM